MDQSTISNIMRYRVFGNSLLGGFLKLNEKLWNILPPSVTGTRSMRAYGAWSHTIALEGSHRTSYFYTSFLRNRAQLELASRFADKKRQESSIKIAVLASSIGAEVYSVLWAIRSKRPDLKVIVNAVDKSEEAVEFGRNGVYSGSADFTDAEIFAHVTKEEMATLFDNQDGQYRIKPEFRESISWRAGDAGDPDLASAIGQHDMVFANNFLCHMSPENADKCLRNVVKLIRPGGYLFVSGIDLDVRMRVAKDLALEPVNELLKEAHNGDRTLVTDWPFKYWGLEPFDSDKPDWAVRYASVFRVKETSAAADGPRIRGAEPVASRSARETV